MRRAVKRALVAALVGMNSFAAQGATVEFLMGPPCFGAGSSNGPTMTVIDYQINFVTKAGTETIISIFPGVLVGHRFQYGSYFLSLGGGVVLSTVLGLGAYSAFGYQSGTGEGLHFVAEYTHAAGVGQLRRYTAPKALRFGLQYEF